jgi:ribosome-associated toxin RatA of RatAB toxin-antitoxin module
MTAIRKHALVPYSAAEMYALVENISAYPTFLPWCKEARILAQQGNEVQASITMARSGLEKTFTTRNTLISNQSIEMRLLKGPFSRLYGCWRFQALGEQGCKVSLEMDFEFSNRLLRLTLGPVFTHIIDSLVEAFTRRAQELYGKR